MKELVGAFNQVKALVGAFFVIVKTDCETDGSYAALFCALNCCRAPGNSTFLCSTSHQSFNFAGRKTNVKCEVKRMFAKTNFVEITFAFFREKETEIFNAMLYHFEILFHYFFCHLVRKYIR